MPRGHEALPGRLNIDDNRVVPTLTALTAQWAYGDIDYDGEVDDDDVTAMATFYNPSAPPVTGQDGGPHIDVDGYSLDDFLAMMASTCGQHAADVFASAWAMRGS